MILRKRQPVPVRLYALIGVMVFFWAMNFIVSKIALRSFPPLLISAMRTSIAGALILPLFLRKGRSDTASIRADAPRLLLIGVLGVALNQVLFVLGISMTSVAHSALVIGTTPILVLLLAAAIGQERLTGRKLAGMAIALAGILTLNVAKSGTATVAGDLLTFCAGLAFAMFTVFGKEVASRHGSVTVNTFAYAGGTILLLPVIAWYARGFRFDKVPPTGWAAVLFMGLFPSLICYLIYYHALAFIPASRLSAFSYVQPLLATGGAAFVLGERITAATAGGGLLVLAGVWVTERGG